MADPVNKGVETIEDRMLIEVPKEFFFEGMILPVNVYLKMKPNSYLVVGKKGEKAHLVDLRAFNQKGSQISVKIADYPILVTFVTQFTNKVVNEKTVPDDIKVKFVAGLVDDAVASLERSGFASVEKIKNVGGIVVKMSQEMSSTFDEISKILATLPQDKSKHAMSTCFLSVMIAEEMKLTQNLTFEKLAMGSMLHDIGLKFIPQEILNKPKHLWSPDELKTYQQHPMQAVEMLRNVKEIPMDVLIIVGEHHENAQGTGYPKKLRDVKISPLSRIVALADTVADLLFPEAGNKAYKPDEVITYIEDILGQPFNKAAFLALKNLINKKHLADKKSA